MSKRRSNKKSRKPNIPQETLARARRQAGLEADEPTEATEITEADVEVDDQAVDEPEPVAELEQAEAEAEAEAAAPAAASPARQREAREPRTQDRDKEADAKPRRRTSSRVTPEQIERAKKKGELDAEQIEYLLSHPVKVVTEEELHADYGHVIADLRNMGILAAALLVVLVVLAQVL